MCRHIYDWNIVNCDVKQPIQLNSTLHLCVFPADTIGGANVTFPFDALYFWALFADNMCYIFYHQNEFYLKAWEII